MTAQRGDIIIIKGQKYHLACEPFEDFVDEKTGVKPKFIMQTTACWRGYYATWKIVRNVLYLTQISGILLDNSKVNLKKLFPDSNGKVIAKWFTGYIYIPMGPLLQHIHMGYESVYPTVLIIAIEKGIVVGQKTFENGIPKMKP